MSDESPDATQESETGVSRRGFVLGTTALGAAVAFPGGAYVSGNGDVSMDPWIAGGAERASVDLADDRNYPNTGRFEDAHGNEFRALAVANPKLTYEEALKREGGSHVFDRRRKREGYGIVRVDHDEGAFVVECWPRAADPNDPDAAQYSGWPHRLPFDSSNGSR